MIIKNKRTGAERFVTPEEWETIKAHTLLKDKFKVVDATDIKKELTKSSTKSAPIIPEEILDFKKRKTAELKADDKLKTKSKTKKK